MCADMDSTMEATRLARRAKGDLPGAEAHCFQFVVMAHWFAKQYSVSHRSQGSTCLDCVSGTLNKQTPNHEIRKKKFLEKYSETCRRWPNSHKRMCELGSLPDLLCIVSVETQPLAYYRATGTHCRAREFSGRHCWDPHCPWGQDPRPGQHSPCACVSPACRSVGSAYM